MNLWRIKDGVPSLIDAILVTAGPVGSCVLFIPCVDPLLEVLEPKGLAYLGYFLALISSLGAGAICVWVFLRNEKKVRSEVVVPRRVFAVTSIPLIFITMALTESAALRSEIGFFEHIGLIALLLVPVYGLVVRLSFKYPNRAAIVALWFNVSLSGVGVIAKAVALFLKK